MKKCENCGNKIGKKPKKYSYNQWDKRRFCSRTCKSIKLKPESLTNWKGGVIKKEGYVFIYNPSHLHSVGKYVKHATIILEQKIGRLLLKKEVAHHIDEDRNNDNPSNLVVMDNCEHSRHHAIKNCLGRGKKYYRGRNKLGEFI